MALPGLKRHVASHLNLTSETFSRTFRRLLDAGLIAQPAENRVQVLDHARLKKVADGLYPKLCSARRRLTRLSVGGYLQRLGGLSRVATKRW